jgi:hypothetical protein
MGAKERACLALPRTWCRRTLPDPRHFIQPPRTPFVPPMANWAVPARLRRLPMSRVDAGRVGRAHRSGDARQPPRVFHVERWPRRLQRCPRVRALSAWQKPCAGGVPRGTRCNPHVRPTATRSREAGGRPIGLTTARCSARPKPFAARHTVPTSGCGPPDTAADVFPNRRPTACQPPGNGPDRWAMRTRTPSGASRGARGISVAVDAGGLAVPALP